MNLKKYYACSVLSLALFTACDIDSQMKEFKVDQPEELEESAYLTSYKTLPNYIDLTNFKLGTSVLITDYLDPRSTSGVVVNNNFNQVSTPIHMKHKAVLNDKGDFKLDLTEKFVAAAKDREVDVFGFTLCDYTNQNGEYLQKLIDPIFVEDPNNKEEVITWVECLQGGKLETGGDLDALTNRWGQGYNASIATGAGQDGSNCAKYVMNSGGIPSWSQIFIKLPEGSIIAEDSVEYIFQMEMKTDQDFGASSINLRRPGQYGDWNPINFVSPNTTANVWKTLEGTIVLGADKTTLTDMIFGGTANLGPNAVFYLDNVSFKRKKVEFLDGYWDHKTVEEKDSIISAEMNKWVNAMVNVGSGAINDWVAVNQPLTDKDPFVLRSDSLLTEDERKEQKDVFYWADYMGEMFVSDIVKDAREAAADRELKLFVSEYGLEDAAKCDALLAYITKWESDGAVIDGISTNVNVSCDLLSESAREAKIEEVKAMLGKLVASGKLVRMSGLNIGATIGSAEAKLPLMTDEHIAMADFYEDLLKAYFEVVPAAQRYGISKDSFLDTVDKLPYGLWDDEYNRKHTYVGFVKGLKSSNLE